MTGPDLSEAPANEPLADALAAAADGLALARHVADGGVLLLVDPPAGDPAGDEREVVVDLAVAGDGTRALRGFTSWATAQEAVSEPALIEARADLLLQMGEQLDAPVVLVDFASEHRAAVPLSRVADALREGRRLQRDTPVELHPAGSRPAIEDAVRRAAAAVGGLTGAWLVTVVEPGGPPRLLLAAAPAPVGDADREELARRLATALQGETAGSEQVDVTVPADPSPYAGLVPSLLRA